MFINSNPNSEIAELALRTSGCNCVGVSVCVNACDPRHVSVRVAASSRRFKAMVTMGTAPIKVLHHYYYHYYYYYYYYYDVGNPLP